MAGPIRQELQTTGPLGLRDDSLPMRLYAKAKRHGVWDPAAIDFTQDRADWATLTELEQETVVSLTSLFQAGEESVTLDLLPLMLAVAREGRLEEELFLTTFLFEEGKHTQFFRRFLDQVVGDFGDLHRFHTPSYRLLFYEQLPLAMNALLADPSPAAQARAAVTYNMIVEGVLAETGYHSYHEMLATRGLMPGLRSGVVRVKQDEARHIAFGVYFLARLVSDDPSLWEAIESRMQELLPLALGTVSETFEKYGDEEIPFGLDEAEFVDYATSQFGKRYARIERARRQTLAEVEAEADADADGLVSDV